MKCKAIILAAAITVAFTLTACNKQSDLGKNDSAYETLEVTAIVPISTQESMNSALAGEFQRELEKAAEPTTTELTTTAPTTTESTSTPISAAPTPTSEFPRESGDATAPITSVAANIHDTEQVEGASETAELESVDEANITELVNQLCLTPRKWGTENEARAAAYIIGVMENYGYSNIERQEFPVYETNLTSFFNGFFDIKNEKSESLGHSENIIVTKPASIQTDYTFVVSAHYDSIGGCLSAIDNASGTASVMEAARILQNQKLPFNMKFIFFGTEEYYLTGSRNYVVQLSETERKNILGCVNVDMVGEADGGDLAFHVIDGNSVLTLVYQSLFPDSILALNQHGGSSDYIPFARMSIPAVSIAQSKPNYELQRLESDLEYFDSQGCVKTAQIIVDFMMSYDISKHFQLLKESFVEDIDVTMPYYNDTGFIFKFSKGALPGYKVTDAYQRLLPNGVSSEYVCTFTDARGDSYSISQIRHTAPEVDVSGYKEVVVNDWSFGTYYLYSDAEKTSFISKDGYYPFTIRIEGQISENEAVSIFENMRK